MASLSLFYNVCKFSYYGENKQPVVNIVVVNLESIAKLKICGSFSKLCVRSCGLRDVSFWDILLEDSL
jgi:hypothetical protein